LATADRLAASGHDVLYVGTPEGLESRLATEAGVEFAGLPARGYDRSRPTTLITSSTLMAGSTMRARGLISEFAPDVVVGFGGYVSIPVGAGAVLKRKPLVLCEQNSVPGMANVFLSRWARSVGITYEDSAHYLKHSARAVLTGNPVREEVLQGDRHEGRTALGIPADARMLLVFGGSRGARRINEAMVEASGELLSSTDLYVVHVAGASEYDAVADSIASTGVDQKRYLVRDYIHSMGSAIAAADLVLARAGATSIAELTALGKPATLVPYPYATDDHQTLNAQAVVDAGGALLLADADVTSTAIISSVSSLMDDPSARATMAAASAKLGRRDAVERVERLILDAASGSLSDRLGETQ